jgi:hypothetical protein
MLVEQPRDFLRSPGVIRETSGLWRESAGKGSESVWAEEPQSREGCSTRMDRRWGVTCRAVAAFVCLMLLGAACGTRDSTTLAPTPSTAKAALDSPVEFSIEEAANLLAQREILVRPLALDQHAGLLDRDAFDVLLGEWMKHHPHWQVLSVHLGIVNMPDERFSISNRPSYFVEIAGPETGNCFYLFSATDGEEFLGACFYPTRSLLSPGS